MAIKGLDPSLATDTLELAKEFFSLPKEKKMEVYTGQMPSEFCGYHPMEEYNINGSKHKGTCFRHWQRLDTLF
jgi:isopenicillin N synthase-like dioxygenase